MDLPLIVLVLAVIIVSLCYWVYRRQKAKSSAGSQGKEESLPE